MIGLDNKFVPSRRQTVTNDDPDNIVEISSTLTVFSLNISLSGLTSLVPRKGQVIARTHEVPCVQRAFAS